MKYLYTNGCSFVAGDGGSDEDTRNRIDNGLTASALIAKKLNCEFYTDARGGSGNGRIRRKTMDWLLTNEDKWNDLIVLIGWSQFTRFEMYNNIDRKYEQLNIAGLLTISGRRFPYLPRTKWSRTIKQNIKNFTEGHFVDDFGGMFPMGAGYPDEFWKVYLTYFYDFNHKYGKYLNDILFLQLFLESNNIKYVFWDSLWSLLDKQTEIFRNKNQKTFDKINLQNWVLDETYHSWSSYLNKVDPLHKKTSYKPYDDHPNDYGHEVWSKEVYKKIEELYL